MHKTVCIFGEQLNDFLKEGRVAILFCTSRFKKESLKTFGNFFEGNTGWVFHKVKSTET